MRDSWPTISSGPIDLGGDQGLVVCSTRSRMSLETRNGQGLGGVRFTTPDALDSDSTTGTIFAVGGGQVIDAAKLFAHRLDQRLVVIPTVLSTDAAFTNVAAHRRDGVVDYVETGFADEVYVDTDLLLMAPDQYHLWALGDLLSMGTAVRDWRFADVNAQSREQLAELTTCANEQIYATSGRLLSGGVDAIQILWDLLVVKTQIGLQLGAPYFEEGTEHFFAYALEQQLPGRHFHGQLVLCGVLVASVLQEWSDSEIDRLVRLLDGLGLFPPLELAPAAIETVMQRFPKFCAQQELNNTVVRGRGALTQGEIRSVARLLTGA